MKKITFLLIQLLFISSASIFSAPLTGNNGKSESFFIENKGQWPDEVLYCTQLPGAKAWITKDGVLYDFYTVEKGRLINTSIIYPQDVNQESVIRGQLVKVKYEGVNTSMIFKENGIKLQGYHNYFLGNDPSKWASSVSLFQDVWVKNLYPGVDIHYYFDKGYLRYDYVLAAGADFSKIKINVLGANNVLVNNKGELVYNMRFGEVIEGDIYAYQTQNGIQHPIHCKYEKKNEFIKLTIGNYDNSQPVIVDPLVYSTFFGSFSDDRGFAISVDNVDNITVAGYTLSNSFPSGPLGAYDLSHNGSSDVFVTQFHSSGDYFMFTTFIGGSGGDDCYGMVMDGSGNIYLAGATTSGDYPTSSAYDNTYNGNTDVIVTKLNSTGTALSYSTYLGGSMLDWGLSIAIDNSQNAYVTGYTASTDYPTASAYSSTYSGGAYDIFVSKLNASGNSLTYSTYIGGSGYEFGNSIAVNSLGEAYVTGYTFSVNFPTASAYQATNAGDTEGVLFKLNASGNSLLYSTYIGGSGADLAMKMKLISDGSVVICGSTNSTNYPTNAAYDNSQNGGYDVFYTWFNATGDSLLVSSYLGGTSDEYGISFDLEEVNSSYNIILTGNTFSSDFPTSADAYDNASFGDRDVFISKLELFDGGSLLYSTYFGGTTEDRGLDIQVKNNKAYFTGRTNSATFPVTGGNTYDQSHNGNFDVYITILSFCSPSNVSVTNNLNTLTVAQTGALYQWIDCENGYTPISGATAQSYTPTLTGTYAVVVTKQGCADTSNCIPVIINTTGISEYDNIPVMVYPNPATDLVNLMVSKPGILEVFSLDGKLIERQQVYASSSVISIGSYSNGLYLFRFITEDGILFQSKIIKE